MKTTIKVLLVLAVYYGLMYMFNHSGYPFAAVIGAVLFTAYIGIEIFKKIDK